MPKRTPEQKEAWRLYRKWICGRGYAWSPMCSMPDDVQRACMEAIEWGRRNPVPNGDHDKP